MKDTNQALLDSIARMVDDAPSIGVCPLAFKVLYDQVNELIQENAQLKAECDRLMSIR